MFQIIMLTELCYSIIEYCFYNSNKFAKPAPPHVGQYNNKLNPDNKKKQYYTLLLSYHANLTKFCGLDEYYVIVEIGAYS